MNYQRILLSMISDRLAEGESIGHVLSEVLHISSDAAYRRYRGETAFTINELATISQHFGISMNELFNPSGEHVSFYYRPLKSYKETMDNYLIGLHKHMQLIRQQQNPSLLITVNNTPFLQLLNFPYLVRFKLHFWAKNHLRLDEYRTEKFRHDSFPPGLFAIGKEILNMYNSIPSVEIYDPELLRGFAREIYYNFEAQAFEDGPYALFLLNQLKQFVRHLQRQCELGRKFVFGTPSPQDGNDLEMYYNETLNAVTSVYYKTDQQEGLFMAHNYMSALHTVDRSYVRDTKEILDCLRANSSKISTINEKNRNAFFAQIHAHVDRYMLKVRQELESGSQGAAELKNF